MTKYREVELKLEVGDAGALKTHPLLRDRTCKVQAQSTIYYDTGKGALGRAGFSLRVRSSEGKFIQTIKYSRGNAAGIFDRPEWETKIAGPDVDFDAIAQTPLSGVLTKRIRGDLRPLVTCDVERTIWILSVDGSEIEASLDEGKVRGGDKEQRLCELELELRTGEAGALMQIARQLGQDVPLKIGVMTKAERGFALADGTIDSVRKGGTIRIAPAMDVAESFVVIAHACLKHFRMNESLVAERRDAAALHQARVAMRRLRSAFSLFGPVVQDDESVRIREELRWFTGQLGAARNLDVLLKRCEGGGKAELERRLRAAREDAYDSVLATLKSQRFRNLMLDLLGWLEFGRWRSDEDAGAPIEEFARKRLDRRWRKIRKAGRDLAALGEERRHRTRINIKKLRYAVEFLDGLYEKRKRKVDAFLDALAQMQEELGFLNDIATARVLLADIAGTDQDLIPAPEPEEISRHLAAAQKAYAELDKSGPVWRQ
ncbi:CYTH and CHAD domain-containing protein [Sphingosinicella rhizophila]|uniref:CHAD domain-containing protein n=1 Tax=Sphingosinicella rhizophila TaxID=3050082 RepID=A0ABU3QB34_9SPHN|nr:CHAD domain-containing protein [Sphingosinicella sp. GR2756]MDT9600497.1 CHAD domain-containing protein [Sphingosinicella sp. GR2756]